MLTHIVVLYLLYTLNAPTWCWVLEVIAIIWDATKFGMLISASNENPRKRNQ